MSSPPADSPPPQKTSPGMGSPADPNYVNKAFANIATRYELANSILSFGRDGAWRRRLGKEVAERVRAGGHEPQAALDVAAGTGNVTAVLRRVLPESCPIIGADFSARMLAVAGRRKLKNVTWEKADALNLPFESNHFDVVTVAFGLRNFSDYRKGLVEMLRVLRPGGVCAILDFSLPKAPELRWLCMGYQKRVLPVIGGAITGEKEAYEYLVQSIESFPSGEAMTSMLDACGFAMPVAKPMTFGATTLYLASKIKASK